MANSALGDRAWSNQTPTDRFGCQHSEGITNPTSWASSSLKNKKNGRRRKFRTGRKKMRALKRVCAILCIVAASVMLANAEDASSYPSRPIILVVSTPPGGSTDTVARIVGQYLSADIGQPVIIENKPGGNFQVAWHYVRSARPDGYTLDVAENALPMSKALYKRPFDPVTQFDSIAEVSVSSMVLVVSKSLNVHSVADLVALSKRSKEKLNYASAGIGSVSHLFMEVFLAAAGIDAVHVPYRGGGPSLSDVIAGHVPMTMTTVRIAKGFVNNGPLVALAITSPQRSDVLPDVPTFQELGLSSAGVELQYWNGIFGPVGIPEPIKAKLNASLSRILASPKMREQMKSLDIEPAYAPGPVLKSLVAKEVSSWTRFIDQRGIKGE